MNLRVDSYNKRNGLYEVYQYRYNISVEKDESGTAKVTTRTIDQECFTCDCNGYIERHEIWSTVFDEYRESPISKSERENFPGIFRNVESKLAEAIREYNLDDNNFEEPWQYLKPTIGSQL